MLCTKMTEGKANRTLFIRNIPYSFTKEKLEDKFSEFGPVKQCFIVNDKVTGKSRGFGYIKFTDFEDAKKAKESSLTLDGRKVSIDYADISKKAKRAPRKVKEKEVEDAEAEDDELDKVKSEQPGDKSFEGEDESDIEDNKEETKDASGVGQKSGNIKYHKAKMVSLSGLPHNMNETELNQCIQKMGVKQLAECKLLTGGRSAQLKFKCIRDAKRAIRKLHNHPYKDSMLQAEQMSKDTSSLPQHLLKKSRVIVRNLAFQCTEEQLNKAFQACGEITEVKIPVNQAGKKLGFGFVQFSSLHDAQTAVEKMNTQKILGRPVAVDWAIPKAKYESTQLKKEESDSEDEGSFSAESEMSSDEQQTVRPKQQQLSKSQIKVESSDEGVEDDSSDDDNDDDNESDDDEEEIDERTNESEDEDMDNSDNEEEEDEDEEDDDEYSHKKKKKIKSTENTKSDTDDGCTLFLRNLSFDTTEEGLEDYFQEYGKLKYAKVVINQETEHSKGIGFVRYTSKESADACLKAGEEGKISLDGRQLAVTVAVSREKAAGFNEKKEKEKKDARNLYLAREGMIRPGTQAAEGLSKADLDKRMKVEEVKRQKLKNVNIFISPLRLCVRNIPVNVDDAELKKVFKDAAEDKKATVTECRIMRDRARTNAEGKGKSMGFGFVSFTDHQHALAALRKTNNNPDIFGEKKRLIVEFSLENRKALEAQEKRKERMKQKALLQQQKDKPSEGPKVPKKQTTKSPKIPLLQLSEKDKKLKGDKVVKGLPSHWGPKIRHKPRQPQTKQKNKDKKNQAKKRKDTNFQAEGPPSKKQKKSNQKDSYDNFDKMVNKYKNKLMANKGSTKWFD